MYQHETHLGIFHFDTTKPRLHASQASCAGSCAGEVLVSGVPKLTFPGNLGVAAWFNHRVSNEDFPALKFGSKPLFAS